MSIEAMSKAYEALNKSRPFDADNARMQRDAMDALRTAIQQAESEPVAWMWKFKDEEGAAFSSKEPTLSIRDGVSYVPLYTHPASGVPEDVAQDAERYRWLRDSDHWPAPFASSQEPEPVRGTDLDSAIDAAMLAAQAQKGQP